MKTMRLNKIDGINNIEFDVLTNGYVTSTITMDIQKLYKHLTDGRTCNISGASLNKDASDDYMSQIYFPLIESTARDLYNVWLNSTLNDEDGDEAIRQYIKNKQDAIAAAAEQIYSADETAEFDYDFDIARADYDDAEELRLINEFNKQEMGKFEDTINNISEAANELRHEVFGYIPQALDNLINTVSQLADPYLNMMYEMDYDWYDNYINMQAEMFAAA